MLNGIRHNICDSLLGQERVFGWILTGPEPTSTFISTFFHNKCFGWWKYPSKNSAADKYCEEYYAQITTRGADGRYTVSLPFKDNFPFDVCLSKSGPSAHAQFIRNETRFLKASEIKNNNDQVIQEYLDLGHMQPISPSSREMSNPIEYYLPQQAVIKPESTTTKLHVVFNESSPFSSGKSLNDVLHVGAVLETDLILLILKWRMF